MFDFLFSDPGKKIKSLAQWSFVAEVLSSFFVGLFLAVTEDELYFILAFGGVIPAWILCLILYGFGEIVDKHCTPEVPANKSKSKNYTEDKRVNLSKSECRKAEKQFRDSKKAPAKSMFDDGKKDTDTDDFDLSAEDYDDAGTPQVTCPKCGKKHDFDYPKCPYCKYEY